MDSAIILTNRVSGASGLITCVVCNLEIITPVSLDGTDGLVKPSSASHSSLYNSPSLSHDAVCWYFGTMRTDVNPRAGSQRSGAESAPLGPGAAASSEERQRWLGWDCGQSLA